MVAALLFWFTALNKQNKLITDIRLNELKHDDPAYFSKAVMIEDAARRKKIQFIGEGSTFLGLIILGAVFVFRATRRQIRISQQQQNFMMAVTHELKTPIAIAQLNLETLKKRQLEEDKRQKLISNTLEEANRLNTLCNNILFAAQLDAGVYAIQRQEINLTDLLQGCVDNFRIRFPQRVIEEGFDDTYYVMGEPLHLQMLANNLIENALKYAPNETSVKVMLTQKSGKIIMSVADQGAGIPGTEKKRIFRKFYRVGDERTRKPRAPVWDSICAEKLPMGIMPKFQWRIINQGVVFLL